MSIADPINVAAYIGRKAKETPHALAVVCPAGRDRNGLVSYVHWTYAQLETATNQYAAGLDSYGVSRGTRTALLVKPSLAFFGLTFALFKLGAVPVFIDPGIGARNFGRCLNSAQPEAFIGIPAAHAARVVLGWGRSSLKHLITVGRRWGWGGTSLNHLISQLPSDVPPRCAAVAADTVAAILFTSGSTGPPKGAVYTHGMFAAQVRLLREMFDLCPGEIDLCTFPLFALFAPALGWTAVVPDMDFTRPGNVSPDRIFEAIDNWGVTNLFGSPALLERVAQAPAAKGHSLPSLRRVISAGAPVRPGILEAFSSLLDPGVPIHTPYGATESLPIASIASQEILGETCKATAEGKGNCVGRLAPEMEARILVIDDGAVVDWRPELGLAAGEIGEIIVRGPVVSASYFQMPSATALHKIREGNTWWHRTGDVGYFDAQGRLWYCGRKSHRVITEKGTLFTLPCEGIFNVHPQVRRTALVGVPAGAHQEPVLCVEPRAGFDPRDWEQLRGELVELGQRHQHTKPIRRFLRHPSFPVDIRHNAKIFREKLALWAARRKA